MANIQKVSPTTIELTAGFQFDYSKCLPDFIKTFTPTYEPYNAMWKREQVTYEMTEHGIEVNTLGFFKQSIEAEYGKCRWNREDCGGQNAQAIKDMGDLINNGQVTIDPILHTAQIELGALKLTCHIEM